MTTDELSKLTPEEKRVRCATLMGWRDIRECTCKKEHRGLSPQGRDQHLPNYLGDANAALTLCDRLAEEGFVCVMEKRKNRKAQVTFVQIDDKNVVSHYAEADTLPEAIVNAFLLAKG